MIKKILYLVIAFFNVFLLAHNVYAANTYTISIPPGTVVTMGDASGTIPVTITNTGNQDYIGYVKISFDASIYYIGNETVAPAGWQLSSVTNGAGQAYAELSVINPADPTYRIDPGESLTFNVVITGPKSGNYYLPIPSSSSDFTDHVRNKVCTGSSQQSEVWKAKGDTQFTQSGTCDPANACGAGYVQDCFQRKALYSSITATPSSVAGSGDVVNRTITIILTVTNRSTVVQSNVQPSNSSLTINATGAASAVLATGPTPASVGSLAVGASATFQWTYIASGSGSLQFCSFAKNGTGTATSKTVCSTYVAVGDLAATLSISPSQIVSGQSVTVTMTVKNNGTTTVNNISPNVTGFCTNPEKLCFEVLSGSVSSSCTNPNPGSIGNLVPGASSTFKWDCTVTSTQVGSTFRYYGYATASGGINSQPTPAYSISGTISAYSATVSPDTVYKGNTNITFTFTIKNNGAYAIQQVQIYTPSGSPAFPNPSSASPSCGSTPAITGGVVTYPTITGFPSGGTCYFNVTYPSLPNVSTNSNYNFIIKIWDTQTPVTKDPRANLDAVVKITVNGIVVEAIPSDISPNCTTEVIATVTPTPPDGAEVEFQSTNGTWQDITTTKSGEAYATLRAPKPYDASITSSKVTATYNDASAEEVTVTFCNPNPTTCTPCPKKIRWREVVQ